MPEFEGFILIGGASSRMGADKFALKLGGLTFVERIARALSSVTNSISIVGNPQAWRPSAATRALGWRGLGLNSVPDIYEKLGALGGLHAALSACREDWAIVVACDLPFVTGELFVRLTSLCLEVDAVVPFQSDGRAQALCGIYRVGPCLGPTEKLISSGDRRPRALLELVPTRRVQFGELADLAGANRFFENINTPQDYERASLKGEATQAEVMN